MRTKAKGGEEGEPTAPSYTYFSSNLVGVNLGWISSPLSILGPRDLAKE